MTTTLDFHPHDTWFFREARPHNAVGAAELGSLFPPPVRTLAGALRTRIGDASGVDWQAFARDPAHPLRKRIGFGMDLDPLRLTGPFPCQAGALLFPAPANLLRSPEGRLVRLVLGPASDCDLGRVRLPTLAAPVDGAKPLTDAWLTSAGYQKYLAGGVPAAETLRIPGDLYTEEARLGIAMTPGTRTAEQGLLYQTRHLRPAPDLSVRLAVGGLDEQAQSALPAWVRLGGEGRSAGLTLADEPLELPSTEEAGAARSLILTLLTPARSGQQPGLPRGFTRKRGDSHDIWQGTIAGVDLEIHGAACGRPLRRGGWQLRGESPGRPVPVESFLPAGSVWYCRLPESAPANAAERLHGAQLEADNPSDSHWGHGLLACGSWPRSDDILETTLKNKLEDKEETL